MVTKSKISEEEKKRQKENEFDTLIQLIVFTMEGEEYGIRIEDIREVTPTPPISTLPRTSRFLKGVANIRGNIISMIDLQERFGLKKRGSSHENYENTFTLVVERNDQLIGVIVDNMPTSTFIIENRIEKKPEIFQNINIRTNFIEGIGKLDERLIIILNFKEILTFEEMRKLKKNE